MHRNLLSKSNVFVVAHHHHQSQSNKWQHPRLRRNLFYMTWVDTRCIYSTCNDLFFPPNHNPLEVVKTEISEFWSYPCTFCWVGYWQRWLCLVLACKYIKSLRNESETMVFLQVDYYAQCWKLFRREQIYNIKCKSVNQRDTCYTNVPMYYEYKKLHCSPTLLTDYSASEFSS